MDSMTTGVIIFMLMLMVMCIQSYLAEQEASKTACEKFFNRADLKLVSYHSWSLTRNEQVVCYDPKTNTTMVI